MIGLVIIIKMPKQNAKNLAHKCEEPGCEKSYAKRGGLTDHLNRKHKVVGQRGGHNKLA